MNRLTLGIAGGLLLVLVIGAVVLTMIDLPAPVGTVDRVLPPRG
jgi:hypothetical protein